MEMIIVIYGEESFLMNQKLESLKKDFACNEENMNFSIYRGDEDSIEAVYEDLITPPFFTDKKMVVLKKADFPRSSGSQLFVFLFAKRQFRQAAAAYSSSFFNRIPPTLTRKV